MSSGYQKIHGKVQSLMALALKLHQMPKQFGTGRDLSHTEIHLIEIIGDNSDLGVTDIARLIGVTKGAVSQTLKRLEKVKKKCRELGLSAIVNCHRCSQKAIDLDSSVQADFMLAYYMVHEIPDNRVFFKQAYPTFNQPL